MNKTVHVKNPVPFTHDDPAQNDIQWMKRALTEAMNASKRGEVPVGAVLIRNNILISKGGNSPISLNDPTAHAEIIVIRSAAATINNYRLSGTTLYVTLEPCVMCVGAMLHARIDRLVYGAPDPKSGAVSSLYNIGSDGLLNHNLTITGPILEQKCSSILKNFFTERRKTLKQFKKKKI
jgi:tRNA(adenine34) deaminase